MQGCFALPLRRRDRQSGAPAYRPGQKVWLSTKDLQLQVESRKLALHFVGQFEVQLLVNPAAVWLKLPTSMRVHLMFHVSRVKLVGKSSLSSPVEVPHVPRIIDSAPPFTVQRILDVWRQDWRWQFSTGRTVVQRSGPGCLSLVKSLPRTFTGPTQINQVEHQEALVGRAMLESGDALLGIAL